jgi:hypothetical protein
MFCVRVDYFRWSLPPIVVVSLPRENVTVYCSAIMSVSDKNIIENLIDLMCGLPPPQAGQYRLLFAPLQKGDAKGAI